MPEGVPGQVLALMLTRDINFKEKMSLSPHYPGSLTVYVKKIKGLFPCTPMSSGRIQTAWNQYSSSDQFILNCWSSQELGLTGCQWPLLSKDVLSLRAVPEHKGNLVWTVSSCLKYFQDTLSSTVYQRSWFLSLESCFNVLNGGFLAICF